MHDFDMILMFVCFKIFLFIINLINNLGLKLVNSINRGLSFPTQEVDKLLKTLNNREEHILRLRFGLNGEPPRSCEELGGLLKLSRERVCQINIISLSNLRQRSMKDNLDEYYVV